MARGEHPRRTPVYGGLLVIAALCGAAALASVRPRLPGAVQIVVYVVLFLLATAGVLMTFRDYSGPQRS